MWKWFCPRPSDIESLTTAISVPGFRTIVLTGPPLRGVSFEEKYANGSPAGVLFEFMSTTMPPNNPGGLSASTYADLMAYILKRNGFKEGAPLPSDVDALYSLIMAK